MVTAHQLINDPARLAGMEDAARQDDRRRLQAKQSALQAAADRAAAKADKFLDDRGVPENMPVAEYLSLDELSEYSNLEDAFDLAQAQADRLSDREIKRRAG